MNETMDCVAICMNKPSAENMRSWTDLFPHIKIMDAVVGKKLDLRELHPLTQMYIKHPTNCNESFITIPSMGAVGCFYSHIKCWELCVKTNRPLVVIEEDVKLNKFCQISIRAALAKLPPKCNFVSLMYQFARHENDKTNSKWHQLQGPFFGGTQMYVVWPDAAKLFLSNAVPVLCQVDQWIGTKIYLHPREIKGFVLKQRLYTYLDMVSGNLNTSVQTNIAIKKLLPRDNLFYYIFFAIFAFLLGCFVYQFV